jgi:iron complex transport system permease protein
MRGRRGRLTLLGTLAALLLIVIVACGVGAVAVPPGEVLRVLAGSLPLLPGLDAGVEETHRTIIRDIRLPRVILGLVTGMSLALAGAAFQGLFRNPMADPYVLGTSAGAALGAVVALAFAPQFRVLGLGPVPLLAFGGAMAAMYLVYRVARIGHRLPLTGLLLAGIAASTFFMAGVALVVYFAGDRVASIVFWMMGHLGAANWTKVAWALPYTAAGSGIILWYHRDLNLLLFGEEPAGYLGVEVEWVKRALLVAGALLTGGAVAFSGAVGFVGLIVPHVMRLLIGPDHRWLLPASALGGGALLVGADTLARSLLTTSELPVGVVMGCLGGPFFLYLLRRQMVRA